MIMRQLTRTDTQPGLADRTCMSSRQLLSEAARLASSAISLMSKGGVKQAKT